MAEAAARLVPDDFYSAQHAGIFQGMTWLYRTRTPIDLVTLMHALESHGALDGVGGVSAISALLINPWESVHVRSYIDIVAKCAALRRLIDAGIAMVKMGYDEGRDLDDMMIDAQRLLTGVRGLNVQDRMRTMGQALVPFAEEIEQRWNGTWIEDILPTGYFELDRMLGGGFERTEFGIIAARPSIGKTAFAMGIAKRTSERLRIMQEDPGKIVFFSSEMSLKSLLWRALSEATGIPVYYLKRGVGLDSEQKERVGKQLEEMADLPIVIDDTSGPTVDRMREKVTQLQATEPVRLVLFDYIEQAGDTRGAGESEESRVSKVARKLNQISKENDTTVLALSQLSRNVENRPDKLPILADLRYSGMIEQEADVVMLLYRQDYYASRGMLEAKYIDETKRGTAEVIVAKNRNGETGPVTLAFVPEITSFRNLTDGPVTLYRRGA